MVAAAGEPSQFASMWIPISNNRWSPSTYVGGRSPYKPQRLVLVPPLGARVLATARLAQLVLVPVRNGRARRVAVQDVAKQAKATHSCFGGGHVIVTGKPTAQNHFLWNGGKDDVDAWVVLASRYYGEYTSPRSRVAAVSHANAGAAR